MKTFYRSLVLFVACAGWIQSQGQQAKSTVQLADQYFAAGEYYTAAHLYGQFLNPTLKQKAISDFPLNIKGKRLTGTNKGISRTDILFKQAESYRLAHYWQEAAMVYKQCITEDSLQNTDALYWYAVCQRSLGNYTDAKDNLHQYLNTSSESNQYRDAAKKELQTLQYIQQQLVRPDSVLVKMQKLDAPNSNEKGVFAPVHINGNQFLVSSTEADSIQINDTNPYHSRLFYAELNNGNLEMTPVIMPSLDLTNNQGAAAISADGNHLYFSQWKKEKGNTFSSIYYSTKQGDNWSEPTPLLQANVNGYSSKQPFCTTDGKYLFFASDRSGGLGGFDIWYASLNSDGTIGEPINLGTTVNTSGDEQAPFYHNSSNTLVFASNGRPGMGGYDLFSSKGSETTWKSPENMGYPVNSSRDDIYFSTNEKSPLLSNAIFSSDRGAGCCLETYSISKAPKNKVLAGIVYNCNDNTPLEDASVTLKDASGKTWRAATGTDGKYTFELGNDSYQDLSLTINRESYQDKTSSVQIKNTDESNLLVDKLTNADLCIEKTPEPPEPPKLVIKAEDVVTVYFDFDRSTLKSDAVNKLDSIYTVLVENPMATIQISGYTDGKGSEAYNKILSDKRARACANYLLKKGIEASRISFVSFGACCPVEMELINGRDNPDGRSRNRRALINVKKD